MLNRSIAVTALASFLALGTQSAFAEPAAADVSTTTAAATAAGSTSSQARTQAAMTMPVSAARARHAARIPGTFALTGTDASGNRDAQNQAFSDRVMLPPLSGDGGG